MALNSKDESAYPSVDAEQWALERFMGAAQNGWLKILHEILMEEKYPVNQRDKNGRTALMVAAQAGRADAVECLLDAGADVMLQDYDGFDARTHAVDGFRSSEYLRAMELREIESYLAHVDRGEDFDGYVPIEEEYFDLSTPDSDYEWIIEELRTRMKEIKKAKALSVTKVTAPL